MSDQPLVRVDDKFDAATITTVRNLVTHVPNLVSEVFEAVVERGKVATKGLISMMILIGTFVAGIIFLIGWHWEKAQLILVLTVLTIFTGWVCKKLPRALGLVFFVIMCAIGWQIVGPAVGPTLGTFRQEATKLAETGMEAFTPSFMKSDELFDQIGAGAIVCDVAPPAGTCQFLVPNGEEIIPQVGGGQVTYITVAKGFVVKVYQIGANGEVLGVTRSDPGIDHLPHTEGVTNRIQVLRVID